MINNSIWLNISNNSSDHQAFGRYSWIGDKYDLYKAVEDCQNYSKAVVKWELLYGVVSVLQSCIKTDDFKWVDSHSLIAMTTRLSCFLVSLYQSGHKSLVYISDLKNDDKIIFLKEK